MGARLAGGLTRRLYSLVLTNVPGPQIPLYAAGARMIEMFPIVPLGRGRHWLLASRPYYGGVYYGLNADRDTMPDVEVLASFDRGFDRSVGRGERGGGIRSRCTAR